jgi:hypothetical protein
VVGKQPTLSRLFSFGRTPDSRLDDAEIKMSVCDRQTFLSQDGVTLQACKTCTFFG